MMVIEDILYDFSSFKCVEVGLMAQDIVYLDTCFTSTQKIVWSAAVGGVLDNCLILLVDGVILKPSILLW